MTADGGMRDDDVEQVRALLKDAQDRLARYDEFFAKLRHDLRGALSPALLVGDRLAMNDDPQKKKAGTTITTSIDRAAKMLLRRVDDPPTE